MPKTIKVTRELTETAQLDAIIARLETINRRGKTMLRDAVTGNVAETIEAIEAKNAMPKISRVIAGSKRAGKTWKVKLGSCSAIKTITLFVAFGKACVNCERGLDYLQFQIDHLIPQSFYKSNGLKVNNENSNLCILCPQCNQAKSGKDAMEFFGQDKMDVIKAYQDNIPNISETDIESASRDASQLSKMFARKYKGGKFERHFWK